jgi:hypothetical protein
MRIDSSDKLFGVEEFEDSSLNDFSQPKIAEDCDDSLNSENFEIESADNDDTIPNEVEIERTSKNIKDIPLFTKGLVLTFLFLVLSVFIVLSVVSLHVKTKKNALSYELSSQTKLMRRLEKRKAMFELEYSFLRSNESINSTIEEKEWVEIIPQSIKFIRIDQNK